MSDDLPTTLAIGTIASVTQFTLHEVVGHGSLCLLLGERILAVAPLWMRCSTSDRAMVLAGPAANVLAGLVCWAILRWRTPSGAGLRLFLWLSIAFQWLVAAGYLAVGAASGYGDWPVILPSVLGAWPGRIVILAGAAAAYVLALRMLASSAVASLGPTMRMEGRLQRVAFFPSLAAGGVAVLAELVGRRFQPLGLALALGCTAFVGWSLFTLNRFPARGPETSDAYVRRSTTWIVAAAVVALAFVALVGPAFVGTAFSGT